MGHFKSETLHCDKIFPLPFESITAASAHPGQLRSDFMIAGDKVGTRGQSTNQSELELVRSP